MQVNLQKIGHWKEGLLKQNKLPNASEAHQLSVLYHEDRHSWISN